MLCFLSYRMDATTIPLAFTIFDILLFLSGLDSSGLGNWTSPLECICIRRGGGSSSIICLCIWIQKTFLHRNTAPYITPPLYGTNKNHHHQTPITIVWMASPYKNAIIKNRMEAPKMAWIWILDPLGKKVIPARVWLSRYWTMAYKRIILTLHKTM